MSFSGDVAIRIRRLSKAYRITHNRQRITSGAEAIKNLLTRPFRRIEQETFWALQEIEFDVEWGQAVGIIGRNGAGKSTLLKILSRITEPTTGQIDIYGRVGCLLEVGSGFHPELTGRENVFLNGAILGMSRREIQRKFDEIVAFAEVERFLDTPVKRYSSGMMVRLAFAVAAHLNPQILIADEVLAVGDQAFQKKCLGKMKDVAGHGRTVLFVSHNMSAVQTLCSRGIVLQNGRIHIDADVSEAISAYLRTHPQVAAGQHFDNDNRPGVGHIRLCKVETYVDGLPSTQLQSGCNVRWVFQFNRIVPKMDCIVTLYDQGDRPVAQFHSGLRSPQDTLDPEIGSAFECEVEELPLVPGIYRMDVRIVRGPVLQDYVETAMVFDVEPGRINGRRTPDNNEYGNVLLPHRWNCGLPD